MKEAALKYIVWILFALVGIAITFFVFGIELPLYLFAAVIGMLMYAYSKNPVIGFIGGWIGRLSIVLFIVSLIYYLGTKSFFPSNPFNFIFIGTGVEYALGSLNSLSQYVGKYILKLVDIIIP